MLGKVFRHREPNAAWWRRKPGALLASQPSEEELVRQSEQNKPPASHLVLQLPAASGAKTATMGDLRKQPDFCKHHWGELKNYIPATPRWPCHCFGLRGWLWAVNRLLGSELPGVPTVSDCALCSVSNGSRALLTKLL